MDDERAQAVRTYWSRDGLERAILDALAASGRDVDALDIDSLAPADQFHGGGKPATVRLARLADLKSGTRVLDVGGGLGGPARTLAVEFGCHVTVLDLTDEYVAVGAALTARLGLDHLVAHRRGDALALDVKPGSFDVIWTQNSGMNISDKEQLYAGFARVLCTGGRLALQEPMAGEVQPPVYPLMWARDPSLSFLRAAPEMRALIEASGFRLTSWEDVTTKLVGPCSGAELPAHAIQRIVLGDAVDAIVAANQRNRAEKRVVTIQAMAVRR